MTLDLYSDGDRANISMYLKQNQRRREIMKILQGSLTANPFQIQNADYVQPLSQQALIPYAMSTAPSHFSLLSSTEELLGQNQNDKDQRKRI